MARKKISKSQQQIYIDFINQNVEIKSGKITPIVTPEVIQTLWNDLKNLLNATGDGAVKDVDGWKKVITN